MGCIPQFPLSTTLSHNNNSLIPWVMVSSLFNLSVIPQLPPPFHFHPFSHPHPQYIRLFKYFFPSWLPFTNSLLTSISPSYVVMLKNFSLRWVLSAFWVNFPPKVQTNFFFEMTNKTFKNISTFQHFLKCSVQYVIWKIQLVYSLVVFWLLLVGSSSPRILHPPFSLLVIWAKKPLSRVLQITNR